MRTRLAAVLIVLAALATTVAAPAIAIPGGGADPDTPHTTSSLSPRTLRAGETIRFSLSGFPAGEIVNIKIDDGQFCAQAGVHGACVVHQQRIGRDGSVSGSFALPADLAPGDHWLRYLASEEVHQGGEYAGVKGYTLRGGSDFTVVAGGSSASGSGAATTPGTGTTNGVAGAATPTAVVPAGEVLVVPAGRKQSAAEPTPTAAPEAAAGAPSTADAETAAAKPASDDARFPVVGAVGLLVLLAAAAAVLLRARRATT